VAVRLRRIRDTISVESRNTVTEVRKRETAFPGLRRSRSVKAQQVVCMRRRRRMQRRKGVSLGIGVYMREKGIEARRVWKDVTESGLKDGMVNLALD
jgi:hypothetical protein